MNNVSFTNSLLLYLCSRAHPNNGILKGCGAIMLALNGLLFVFIDQSRKYVYELRHIDILLTVSHGSKSFQFGSNFFLLY